MRSAAGELASKKTLQVTQGVRYAALVYCIRYDLQSRHGGSLGDRKLGLAGVADGESTIRSQHVAGMACDA